MQTISILVLFTILFSCNSKEVVYKNQLNVALTSKVSTLDPAVSYDTVSAQVVYQIHETLFEYEYLIRPYTLKPLLAQSLPIIAQEGTEYTFKIKKGIYYHPHVAFKKPRELKAIDFIHQLKRVAFKKTMSNGWWLFQDKIKGLDKFRDEAKTIDDIFKLKVEGLQVLSDYSFKVLLTRPYPQLIYSMAMSFTAPVPEELIRHYNNDLSQDAIGTGPYIFQDWKKSNSIHLTKNNSYHNSYYPKNGDRRAHQEKLLDDKGKKIPFIDEINFSIINEAQTRWLNFRSRKIDFITLTKDHFPIALDEDGNLNADFSKNNINLQIAPTLTYWWLAFNMKDRLLGKNLNLRKAIAHAVDINRYIRIFTNNIGQKANSIYPPGIPGYNPSAKLPYSYDIKKAKQYLKKAGYPNGKGLETIRYDIRGSTTVSRQMGEFIKAELAKVGIKVDIIINSFPAFLKKAKSGQLQFWYGGWAMDYPNGENIVQLLMSKNAAPGPNTSSYSSKIVDKAYTLISTTKKRVSVIEAMHEVENQVNKDLPWVMLFYSRNYILYHDHIKNFRQSDLMYNYYKYLKIK